MTGAPWLLYLIVGLVFVFLARSMFLEIRGAIRLDREEDTSKHLNGKLKEYAIVGLVCIVAYFAVIYLKDGPLQGVSESLWGKPPQSFPASDPFHNLNPP